MIKKFFNFFSLLILTLFSISFSNVSHGTHNTILRIHIESEPKTLDPAQATGVREFQILQALFEGLTRYHPETLVPLPGVAKQWEVSKDGKIYRFFIRENAKWSDGKPVTAADFWKGWEYLLNPKTRSPYAFQLFYLKGAKDYAQGKIKDPKEIGMKVLGEKIFEVTLEKPIPYFLSLTAFSALAPRRTELKQPYQVSNGPFILNYQIPGTGTFLTPNPFYWNLQAIKLNGVLFRPFGNFDTALKFYDATGIDILSDLPPTKVALLKFRADFRNAPLLRTEYFLLNTQKQPLDNIKVRQALALSIDRQAITGRVLKRGDTPFGFLVPPGIPGYTNTIGAQVFDPTRAKELLLEAGYNAKKPLPTLTIHYDKADDRKLVAKAVQEMWQKYLGIQVILFEEEWSDYLDRRRRKDFQVSWGGWYGDYVDPNTFLGLYVSDNPQNYTGWENSLYDLLVLKAQTTLEPKQRAELFQKAESLLLEEAPVLPVLAKAKNFLIQPYVKGYYPNLLDIHPLRDVHSLRP